MKKLILFVVVLLFGLSSFSQDRLKLSSNYDTLYLYSDIKVFVGQKVVIVNRTDKDFVFIYDSDFTSLPRRFSNGVGFITKIRCINGVYFVRLSGIGKYNYDCEIYNAMKFGEIYCLDNLKTF